MIERDAMRMTLVPPTFARMIAVSLFVAFFVDPAASAEPSQSPVVHHDLAVTLDPANHRLKVRDRVRIPGALVTAPFTISLNADLNVQAVSGGLKLFPIGPRVQGSQSGVPVNVYGVEGAMPGQELTGELNYEGVINHAVQQSGGEYAR